MYKVKNAIIYMLIAVGSLLMSGCGDRTGQPQVSSSEMSEAAKKYNGKIVKQPSAGRGKEDGWFLVKNGKRSWIVDGAWLDKNGFKPTDVIEISSQQFNSIPEDPQPIQ
jgi:hypothetical protein